MSKGAIVKVVIVAVGVAFTYAAGFVTANIKGKAAREDLAKENEKLRTDIRAYFTAVAETNEAMQAAMVDIVSNPPMSVNELIARLKSFNVPDTHIERVVADVQILGFYDLRTA